MQNSGSENHSGRSNGRMCVWAAALLLAWNASATMGQETTAASKGRYLDIVRTFADNVLEFGRDVYGPEHTPLFVDGININTHEPAVLKCDRESAAAWKMPNDWVLSNLANQQNLFRVFVSLTQLTGDPKYKQAAKEATRYAFDHCRHESGLLYWGGHTAWDAATDQPVGEGRTHGFAGKHEFKNNLPFYELMWEVDPELTKQFIEAFWSNHVLDWSNLDMNRHGVYEPIRENLWQDEYVGGPLPFVGKGLTFMNAGSDLVYAGAILTRLTGDERPLVWAKRMAKRYVEVRHPTTGLGADNYSIHQSRRMIGQFGEQFGERFNEAGVTSLYGCRYGRSAVTQLKLYEILGTQGKEFKQWALEDLKAYAVHAYDWSDHTFWSLLIDGTRLCAEDRKKEGYVRLDWLTKRPPEAIHFWAYALAYKQTGDVFFWKMCREMAIANQLADLGETPGGPLPENIQTSSADPNIVFGLLDLFQATKQPSYLALARKVGDNLCESRFHKGFFVNSKKHIYAKFDDAVPLALLYLEAAERHPSVQLPVYAASKCYLHCRFEGLGRTYDHYAIYTQTAD